jgi:S-adenosylmethionine decarboxylase proenzyme
METLGRHVIAELDGCDARLLSQPAQLRKALLGAAEEAGATILTDEFFTFPTGGVSGFVLLAESHISIHTWPEHAYAAVDIYTCGSHTMPERACEFLSDRLRARQVRSSVLDRGLAARDGGHEHVLASRPARSCYAPPKTARIA